MKDQTAIPLSLFETGTLEPPPAPLKERLRSVEWSFSRTAQASASSPQTHSGLLLEFSNDLNNAETLYEEAGQLMAAALQNFAQHPRYEKIRNAGRSPDAEIERLFKLRNLPCRVTGI